jgi:hypothetical protein
MSENKNPSLEIIPEVFFDIIGRIIPGTFIILIAYFSFPNETQPIIDKLENFHEKIPGIDLSLIVVSYYIAILFQQLTAMTMAIFKISEHNNEIIFERIESIRVQHSSDKIQPILTHIPHFKFYDKNHHLKLS